MPIEIISINENCGDSPLLSIGIPTYPARKTLFDNLCQMLLSDSWRYSSEVEIIALYDDQTASIGEKRNLFMDIAKGKYLVQVDDDDSLTPDYFDVIMPYLRTGLYDCISHLISAEFYKDGQKYKEGIAKVSLDFNGFTEKKNATYLFQQGIYYKVPIKAEISRKERFKPINYGEDHDWMRRLRRHIKSELHLDQVLYRYTYETYTGEQHNKRYGIK